MASGIRKLTAYAVAFAAGILGPASLLIFAVFLWTGPFGVVHLHLTEGMTLVWDVALCCLFFLQHSAMVRRSFQTRWQRWAPACWHGVTYTITSAGALFLLAGMWQPSSTEFYVAEGNGRRLCGAILLLCLSGVLWGIRSLGNFDAFGIQALLAAIRRSSMVPPVLTVQGPYRFVRHPFYALGIVALWAAPVLSLDRAALNVLFTVWIVAGTMLEERDLVSDFGDAYRSYQRAVPMLIPGLRVGPRRALHGGALPRRG